MGKLLKLFEKKGISQNSKKDPNDLIEEAAKDPNFFVEIMTAINVSKAQLPLPKDIKIETDKEAARATVIWPDSTPSKTDVIKLVRVNGSWFVLE